jgi:hypothetical protein
METKFGIGSPREDLRRHVLAEKLPSGGYLLDGQDLTAEELEAHAKAQYEDEHQFDELKAELGLDNPTLGANVDRAARKLLASRGIWDPTADEYLLACTEVGAA